MFYWKLYALTWKVNALPIKYCNPLEPFSCTSFFQQLKIWDSNQHIDCERWKFSYNLILLLLFCSVLNFGNSCLSVKYITAQLTNLPHLFVCTCVLPYLPDSTPALSWKSWPPHRKSPGGGGGGTPYIFHIHMCRQNAPLFDDFSLVAT